MVSQHNSPNEAIGTVIHIGAGRCSELPQYLAAHPQRIILIEPQPDRARELRQQTAGQDHITVIEAAVSGSDTGNRLQVFNQRDLSSLRTPTGLLELYPGLRTTHELDVDSLAPDQLIERAELTPDNNHWLIIDAPGEEAAIIDTLADGEHLAAFTRIDLHCGATSFFEGSQPAPMLLRTLAKQGQEIEANDTETDPERPHWTLRRNALKLENIVLQQQLETSEQEKKSFEERTSELEQQINELAQERDKRVKEAEETQNALQRLQDDLSAALRVQHLRDADLKELKGRYEKILTVKERQDELLRKLTSRLELAARHLQELEMESNADERGELRNLLHALAGDRNE